VVGSRGTGRVSGVLLGSVAMAITSHGTAPVAVIPAEGPGGEADGPVVVGVDGSPISEAAIAFAFDEAAVRGVRLLAVHTWNDVRPTLADPTMIDFGRLEDGERAALSELLAGWRDKYPDVDVRPIVLRGRPTPILLRYATQAQLVVVGSRGRGGFAGMMLGSTSHSLITHAIAPVVVVRPDSLR
jgi:nucleotide-binding universal stress UspA family protein